MSRIETLIGDMTLAEKLGQLTMTAAGYAVTATASTSVDLPTPPFVFMTATVLRMPPTYPSAHIPIECPLEPRDGPRCGLS